MPWNPDGTRKRSSLYKKSSGFKMKGISPLKDHEKTPDGKVIKHPPKKTEMEFHPSLLQKPNVGPPYEKKALGYPVKEKK